MILEPGEKLLVVHRRLYKEEDQRYFLGQVEGYDAGIAKIRGCTWLRDSNSGKLVSKKDESTKIVSIASGNLIVYQLPTKLELAQLRFVEDENLNAYLTDSCGFRLNVTESIHATAVGA